MGLRHRSIRLRVGVLITVPVLCLLALYGFVASITLGNALREERAKTLRTELADPVSSFQQQVAEERALALLSLANPTNTQVASALGVQESATQRALTALTAAVQSRQVTSLAAGPERAAITTLLKVSKTLDFIRGDISDDAISMRAALADYDAIINAGYPVINEAVHQLASVSVVTQALAVVNLERASQATQEEWDLLSADMAQRKFPNTDRLEFAALASQRQTLINIAVPELDAQYRVMLARNVPAASSNAMAAVESEVSYTPWHRGAAPTRLAGSKMIFIDYSVGLGKALSQAAVALENQIQQDANTVILELVLAAGLGLLGTVASIALSLIIGRGLIRQLRELRESALTLAHEKLPDVISRLRSGEPVDLADYEPAEVPTSNEIQQVQDAFSVVQQTAVQAAVDEARLRRGISDVFRNLAGRSQSLLHRQLTLLDGMERRATEPEELEDLFRIDHLTTRMRRHAEGLIILSGDAPARGWRQPVPLVDVLRAAVAEVEDYTRVRVLCRTSAAVAGHAVADVIHLIAELAENATVFSPPNTPVRIQGDVVGRGFAIEIEDRGLGISAARLEEINVNLANPPQFDLSGSDRLGLFIAGQLAQRHDIKITLRPSVFGGTTAIVLIPTALVVDESGPRDPALPPVQDDVALAAGFSGRHAALAQAAAGPGNGSALSGGPGTGPNGTGPNGHGHGPNGIGLAGSTLAGDGLAGNGLAVSSLTGDAAPGPATASSSTTAGYATASSPSGRLASETDGRDRGAGLGESAVWADPLLGYDRAGQEADSGSEFLARRRRPAPTAGTAAASGTEPAVLTPVSDDSQSGLSRAEVAELGLPVRVRQASLAPQLRKSSPGPAPVPGSEPGFGSRISMPGARGEAPGLDQPGTPDTGVTGTGVTGTGVPVAGPRPGTPEAARNTVRALQRGWQLGRSIASTAALPPDSVFTPRRPPSGQTVDPYAADAGPNDTDSAGRSTEHSSE